jgi:hypothetical protein
MSRILGILKSSCDTVVVMKPTNLWRNKFIGKEKVFGKIPT